jgi:sugar transferase (PEP-CTERM system associated)
VKNIFHPAKSFFRFFLGCALAGLVLACIYHAFPGLEVNLGLLGLQTIFAFLFLTGWRFAYGHSSFASNGKVGAFIVGAGESGLSVYRFLKNRPSRYEVKGFIDDDPALQGKCMGSPTVVGTLNGMIEAAEEMGVRSAILAVNRPHTPRFTRTVLEARLAGMEIIELPSLYERTSGRVPIQLVEDQWLLFSDGFQLLHREYIQKIKRIMDFTISGLLLVISFPLLLMTALAIRIDSPGPVFYFQERTGLGGKPFRVVKFRSMTVHAETQGAQWAKKNDLRITRVGRWIRLFRIDELPQIWNVFLGDMSLIGPRPERPEFVKDLEVAIPYYSTRHSVRPGITGWAQVNFHYGASVDDARRKLEYDLYYIKNMSIFLDLKIILRTVGVILLGDGAR